MLFDHLHGGQALPLGRVPEVLLDAGAGVLPEGDTHGGQWPAMPHHCLIREHGAMRRPAKQLQPVERVGARHPAADHAEEPVHRPMWTPWRTRRSTIISEWTWERAK